MSDQTTSTDAALPAITRYFHTTNANREWLVGKARLQTRFEPYSFAGGALCGMAKTDDPIQHALLDELLKTEKSLVEITEAQFWQKLGIKQTATRGTFDVFESKAASEPAKGFSIEAKPGVVVPGSDLPPPPIEVTAEPVKDVSDLLQVGDVTARAARKAKISRAVIP